MEKNIVRQLSRQEYTDLLKESCTEQEVHGIINRMVSQGIWK